MKFQMVGEGDKVICDGGIGSKEAQVSEYRNRGTFDGYFSGRLVCYTMTLLDELSA